LDDYVKNLSVPTRVLRSNERIGLIKARLLGANNAKGEVLTFLDAHCECTIGKVNYYHFIILETVFVIYNIVDIVIFAGWLEPLLEVVGKNVTRIVAPVIDIINDNTFSYTR